MYEPYINQYMIRVVESSSTNTVFFAATAGAEEPSVESGSTGLVALTQEWSGAGLRQDPMGKHLKT
jgi:hypothetical protein